MTIPDSFTLPPLQSSTILIRLNILSDISMTLCLIGLKVYQLNTFSENFFNKSGHSLLLQSNPLIDESSLVSPVNGRPFFWDLERLDVQRPSQSQRMQVSVESQNLKRDRYGNQLLSLIDGEIYSL